MNGFFIGRLQPFHLGHLHAINFALSKVDRLFVGIGSSNRDNDSDNPFTADERRDMIRSSLAGDALERVSIYDIPDTGDHKRWVQGISEIVPHFDIVFTNDQTSQDIFDGLGVKYVGIPFEDRGRLSGTNIRDLLAKGSGWEQLVPDGTRKVLDRLDAAARLRRL